MKALHQNLAELRISLYERTQLFARKDQDRAPLEDLAADEVRCDESRLISPLNSPA